MDYQWDPHKARINFRKHGVSFADAVLVFEDTAAITIEDEHNEEERYITIGMDAQSRVLIVVFTWRNDTIRIISARKTTPLERRQYEEYHEK
ncbi:MAG: BrnT family toxin [Anaerolineales bacterium]